MGREINKLIISISFILIFLGVILILQSQNLGKLRMIFCDVGQGDGSLIITPNGHEIVIDGGPGNKMSGCLSSHMPFWDRDVDIMIVTHSQKDHMEGQIGVFADYFVKNTVFNGVGNETNVYQEWKHSLDNEKTNVITPKIGEKLVVGGVTLTVLWPGENEVNNWKNNPPKDLNETSVVVKLNYDGVCALYTGDIPLEILETVVTGKCDVLKVGHHGSKTGTNSRILDILSPKMAVIQVGKNSYGHPNKEVVDMLTGHGAKVLRNDLEGTVEIDVDERGIRMI